MPRVANSQGPCADSPSIFPAEALSDEKYRFTGICGHFRAEGKAFSCIEASLDRTSCIPTPSTELARAAAPLFWDTSDYMRA